MTSTPPPGQTCPDCHSSPATDHVDLCDGCGTCNECHAGWYRTDTRCIDCAEADFALADSQ
ncbi:hypothetical protein ACFC0K_16000 [Streptomyces hydrogenans]|uniref:hypothetical protein n=1 Tax=Streptomyces hydrogenans TaxID=1873719 RepID=UPI0035D96746